nr:hypothetical protein [Tanacetum cinerariifolium]
MIEKSMYDSWALRIHPFINGKKNGRMMLDLIDNGLLVYPTVEENGLTRPKKYSKLTEAQQLHDNCDQVQVNTKFLNALPSEWSKFVTDVKLAKNFGLTVPTFQQEEDPIDCITKAMACLSDVASRFPPLNNQLIISSNPINQAIIQDGRVISFAGTGNRGIATSSRGNYAASQAKILDKEHLAFIADSGIAEVYVAQQTIPQNSAFQTEYLDAYDSDCDNISSAKAVLIENLSSCDLDVLSEVPYFDTYLNNMINQDVQEMAYSEQTHIMDFPDNEITSDNNIISYSQYL